MSFHWLRLSPSQCPEYRPWLGKVEREMTNGRFPWIWIKALENHRKGQRQEVRAAPQEFTLTHNRGGRGQHHGSPAVLEGWPEYSEGSAPGPASSPICSVSFPPLLGYPIPKAVSSHSICPLGQALKSPSFPYTAVSSRISSHPQAGRKRDAWVPRCGFGFHQPIEVVEVVVHRGFLLRRGTHCLCREGIAQHGCQEGEVLSAHGGEGCRGCRSPCSAYWLWGILPTAANHCQTGTKSSCRWSYPGP